MQSARDIYQSNLDRVSHALLTRDLTLMLTHLALPQVMMTDDTEVVISSADEMLIAMTEYRDYLERAGVVAYRRTCREAAFLPGRSDMIVGQHDTVLERPGQEAPKPYPNHMTLMRIEGQWKAIRIEMDGCNSENPVIVTDMAHAQRHDLSRRGGGS